MSYIKTDVLNFMHFAVCGGNFFQNPNYEVEAYRLRVRLERVLEKYEEKQAMFQNADLFTDFWFL